MIKMGLYVLARRFMKWRLGAIGIACVFSTLPGVALQMRSTYVDTQFVALFLASLHFMTRPVMRGRDILMGGLALGLLGGMKGTGVIVVPCLFSLGLVRSVLAG